MSGPGLSVALVFPVHLLFFVDPRRSCFPVLPVLSCATHAILIGHRALEVITAHLVPISTAERLMPALNADQARSCSIPLGFGHLPVRLLSIEQSFDKIIISKSEPRYCLQCGMWKEARPMLCKSVSTRSRSTAANPLIYLVKLRESRTAHLLPELPVILATPEPAF